MTKNTYGTGSFVLTNIGAHAARPGRRAAHDGRVVARTATVSYAMEGAIFITGAAVQWLRDGLRDHRGRGRDRTARGVRARQRRRLRRPRVHRARLAVVGSVRARHDRRHHARHDPRRTSPAPSSKRWRSRPPMWSTRSRPRAAPRRPEMRVDGGASVMDLLCQFQADVLGVPVRRAAVQETTALGAAFLAGLAEGVWDSPADRERDVAGRRVVRARRWTRPNAPAASPTGNAPSNVPATGRRTEGQDAAVDRSAARLRTSRCARCRSGRSSAFLRRVRVDVLVAGELPDLVHHLVGELAQRHAVVRTIRRSAPGRSPRRTGSVTGM